MITDKQDVNCAWRDHFQNLATAKPESKTPEDSHTLLTMNEQLQIITSFNKDMGSPNPLCSLETLQADLDPESYSILILDIQHKIPLLSLT